MYKNLLSLCMNNCFNKEYFDFKIVRVSEKKFRINFKIPIYLYDEDNITSLFLGYEKIGLTLRDATEKQRKNNLIPIQNSLISCRPLDKFLSKLSGIYAIKKKLCLVCWGNTILNIENEDRNIFTPCYILYSGDGIRGLIRKKKIEKLLVS